MAKPFVVSGDSRSTAVDVERTALHVDLLAELVLLLADGHHAIADLDESAAIDISLEGEVLVVAANRPDTLSVELSRTAHAADSNIAAIVVQSYRGVDLRILQASLHIEHRSVRTGLLPGNVQPSREVAPIAFEVSTRVT